MALSKDNLARFIRNLIISRYLLKHPEGHANSHIIGELLMVIIVIMLAALVMLMVYFPVFSLHPFLVPAFIEIRGSTIRMNRCNEHGLPVILFHTGPSPLKMII